MDNHRELLTALQARLEAAMDDAPPQMLPQIAGQYRACLTDIAALDSEVPQAGIQDDLKAKRTERKERQRRATPRVNVNK
jgi:hypothetical protein